MSVFRLCTKNDIDPRKVMRYNIYCVTAKLSHPAPMSPHDWAAGATCCQQLAPIMALIALREALNDSSSTQRVHIYDHYELGPKRTSPLWILGLSSVILVYMDPLGQASISPDPQNRKPASPKPLLPSS